MHAVVDAIIQLDSHRSPAAGADAAGGRAAELVRQRAGAPVSDHLPAQRARHLAGPCRTDRGHELGGVAGRRDRPGDRWSTGSGRGGCCGWRWCCSRPALRASPRSTRAWQGFAAAAVAGIGNGGFWPAQSTLLAGLTERWQRPSVFSVQRITMNLGIGLGGVVGGLIASTTHPGTFQILFVGDALTFVALRRRAALGAARRRRPPRARALGGLPRRAAPPRVHGGDRPQPGADRPPGSRRSTCCRPT